MPITTPADSVVDYGGDESHFAHVLKHLIEPAVSAEGYTVIPPLIDNSEIIQGEIIRHLATADLVLCDISGWNANVFFELGIRVALDRPVALIRDSLTETIPFDNNMISCHTYNSVIALWSIEEEVRRLRRHVASAGSQERNAMWRYFGIAQVASVDNSSNPIEAKLDMVLSELSARFYSSVPAPVVSRESSRVDGGQRRARVREVSFPSSTSEVRARESKLQQDLSPSFRQISPEILLSALEVRPGTYDLYVDVRKLPRSLQEESRGVATTLTETDGRVRDVVLTVK